jgi:hypothetical protein
MKHNPSLGDVAQKRIAGRQPPVHSAQQVGRN